MTKTILVIDDDDVDRKKMVTALEKEGYTVMEALDVDEAMLKAQQTLPDLVIIDVVTVDSNTTGFDSCHKIKAAFQTKPPFVLMVTGNVQGVNVSLANKMGADGFEAKTSDMAHIVKAARNILSSGK